VPPSWHGEYRWPVKRIDRCTKTELLAPGTPQDWEVVRGLLREYAAQIGVDLWLDTLSAMETARALYQDLGFAEIAPFCYNLIPGSHYLKAEL